MNLAIAEFRRAKGRFASITGALSLIVFLVLVLGALADGLFFGGTGAVRSSTAQAYAFSQDAEGSLIRSRLPLSDEAELEAVPGVTQATAIGALITTTSSVPGGADVVVMGFVPEADPAGVPSRVAEGRLPSPDQPEGVAVDAALADQGLGIGATLDVGGVRQPVVGVVEDAQYQSLPTVWVALDTYGDMRAAVRPESAGQPLQASTFGLALAEGTDPATLSAPAGIAIASNEETYLSIPGVREQRSSLDAIIYASLAVGGLVVALFFALVVLEKRELFAALKALGASSSKLGSGVVLQALGATATAVVIGAVAARAVGFLLPEGVPFLFRPETLVVSAVLTVLAGVIGAVLSLRRISRIDPATALGGSL
ncbi:MAG: ABC transporter permease [Candidatus Nanopelagicales bacterium]|jgi:putative ABC transport system permease protein|nr:ABC transporter permease [Candidatus Nanopelagicales bacterium]